MALVIREATVDDWENLCNLFDEADQLHRAHQADRFQAPNGPARDREFVLDLLADQMVKLLVGEGEGNLLGLVQAALKSTPPLSILVPRKYVVVETLVVKAAYRQQGIGARLMDEIQQWAIASGADAVELNVYEFNQGAIAFYRQLGYEPISHKLCKSIR